MSVQSLPHLNGNFTVKSSPKLPLPSGDQNGSRKGSSSSMDTNKSKYNSLPSRKVLERQPSKFDEVIQKRQRLNRNGSIGTLQFRGIKKEFLEKQTSMIAHSMTVGFCLIERETSSTKNKIIILLKFPFPHSLTIRSRSCTKRFSSRCCIMWALSWSTRTWSCSTTCRRPLR